MGWWDAGEGDDTLGDGPADTITDALSKAAQDGAPSLATLLAAVLEALRRKRDDYVSDGKFYPLKEIVAMIERPDQIVRVRAGDTAPEATVNAFADAFEAIAVEYEESEMERKPRVTELLATIDFVLGPEPERYLSGFEETMEIVSLIAH